MKKITLIIGITVLFAFCVTSFYMASVNAAGVGMPHNFWGTAQDTSGKDIPAGIIISAKIVDDNGTPPVDNSIQYYNKTMYAAGEYGSLTNITRQLKVYSEDGNPGDTVYLYIAGIYTGQSTAFIPSGGPAFNINITDEPRILDNNAQNNGTTGDPFTFNVTIREIVDSGDNLTVKVNWTHGTNPSYVNVNNTMNFTGGNRTNGYYFEKTVDLYCCSVQNLSYFYYVNDTSDNSNTSQIYWANVTDNDPPVTNLSIAEPVHPNSGTNHSNVTSSSVIYLNTTDNIGSYFVHYKIWNTTDGWSDWSYGSSNQNRSFTLDAAGKNYIEYYANDSAGNNETHHNVTLWVDDTPPTSNINAITPYWNNTGSVTLTATANDALSGVASVTLYYNYSADNSVWEGWVQNTTDYSYPYSWSFSFPNGTGYYQFYSTAVDNLSNSETYAGPDAYCGYDNISPSSSVSSIDGYYWKNSTITINATANDALSGIASVSLRYRFSSDNFSSDIGGWVGFGSADVSSPYSWSFNFTNGSGYYQFYSIAVDNATNLETNGVIDAYCGYDNESPISSVDAISGYWKNGSQNPLNISVNASDNHSGVACVRLYYRYNNVNNSWGGVSWNAFGSDDATVPYNWSFNFTDGSGYYQFYSIAVDNVSNNESYNAVDALCGYDTNAPDTSVNEITPYWNNTGSVTLTAGATDALSGIASVSFYYYNSSDNSTFSDESYLIQTDTSSPYSCTFTFDNGTGYYKFYTTSVDNVGNIETPPTNNDTKAAYDNSAPSSTINNRTAGYYSYFQNSSLTITSTFNESSETGGSGISSVRLYYWYHNATDNITKENNSNNWTGHYLFDTNSTPWINTSAVSWSFNFSNGTGYYRFCSRAYDNATNAESLLALNQTNGTECFYNNTLPNIPSGPGPSNGSTGQSTSITLNWTGGDPDLGDTVTYDVYFGTASIPVTLVSNNQNTTSLSRSGLSNSQTYYWKVVAWDNHNASREGPIWHFATEAGSTGPTGPTGPVGPIGSPPSTPDNVRCVTSSDDNTPTFEWDASTDSNGISEYYVKIDDESAVSIGNFLTYTWPTEISDGNHTFYVRARDTTGSYGQYGNCSFTIDTSGSGTANQAPVADAGGPYSALTFKNITFDGSNSSDDVGIENYTWDFGDGTIGYGELVNHSYNTSGIFDVTLTVKDAQGLANSNITTANITLDSDADGYSDEMEESYGTNKTDPNDKPVDSDGDGTPDDPSPDGKYSGDADKDGDNISDEIEEILGSDPHKNDVKEVKIHNVTYYAVDEDGDGVADKYYNSEKEAYVTIKKQDDGTVLIDENNDGEWDYIYNPVSGATQVYILEDEDGGIPWYVYILVIIAIILIIVFVMFKTGYLYIEEEEPKKPEKKKTAPKKETKKKTPNKKKK